MDFAGNIYDAQAGGIFRYTADADGVYQKPETDAPFLAWEPSGLRLSDVEILSVLDGDHFFVRFSGLVDEKAVYAVLWKTDEQWKEKQNVTMMLFDMKLAETLRTAAYVFNRENKEYRITILESDLKTADPEVSEVVFTEFSEGRVPDLLVFNEDMESLYLNLDKQEYLTDLSEFAPQLTGSARAAVSGGSDMKRVPIHIWYNTLAAAADTDMPIETLTMEMLTELVGSLQEEDILFSDLVYDRLYSVIQSAFVDKTTGECHFDTPEFRTFLEILQNREAYFSEDAAIFAEQYTQMLAYQFTDTTLMEDILQDRVRLVHLPLYNYKALGVAKIAFVERPFSLCGYPGVMAVPQFVTSLALPEAASCPEGAKVFLEFLLSDAVQTSSRVVEHAFPVTGSAVDRLLETDWFIFGLQFHEEENGRLYTSAFVDTAEKSTRPDRELWEPYAESGSMQYTIVEYTPTDKEMLRALLDNPGAGQINDPVLQEIIMEEISAWRSGDRTMEDTIRVLQSRVSTYLAE